MYGTINLKGIEEIKGFLESHHTKKNWDENQLNAWAADAEFQLGEGNSASIEISQFYSKVKCTQTFTVSDEGIDWHENYNENEDR